MAAKRHPPTKTKSTPRPKPRRAKPVAAPSPDPAPSPRRIAARWEAAIGSRGTFGHFAHADILGPLASTDELTRQTLRMKTRYERENNHSLAGLIRTLSTSIVGSGPRARVGGIDAPRARALEKLWSKWAKRVGLGECLRLGVEGRYTDGDAFAQIVLDPTAPPGEVPLALQNFEAEQIGAPGPAPLSFDEVWGVRIDRLGRPTHYHIYNRHPGDTPYGPGLAGLADPFAGKWVPAAYVLHFFHRDRPGQLRGVTPFAPSINSGAQSRRYGSAVLGTAEKNARIAGLLETEYAPDASPMPAAGDPEDPAGPPMPFQTVPIATESIVTLPVGAKFKGHDPGQPTTLYGEFVSLKNAEWGTPVGAPKGVVNLNSENASFSSARLDQLIFRDGMWLEKDDVTKLLEKLWSVWLTFLAQQPQYAQYAREPDLTVEFFFPGFSAMDPLKDTKAIGEAIDRGLTNLAIECAERGLDWEEVAQQRARELARFEELGIPATSASSPPAPPADPATEPAGDPPADPAEDPADDTTLDPSGPAPALAGTLRATAPASTFEAVGAGLVLEAIAEGTPPATPRRFSAVAYTGAAMLLPATFGPVPAVVDLAGLQVPTGPVPILRQHDHDRILGHATARIVAGQVTAAGVLSMPGEETDQVVTAADAGFPWQASIAGPFSRVEFVEAGQSVRVNGRLLRGPLNVVRSAQLREITVTPLGADGGTSVAIAATFEGLVMDFSAWLTARGLVEATLTPAARTTLEAAYRTETTPPPSPPPPPAAVPPGPPPPPAAAPTSFEATIQAQREEDGRRERITQLVTTAIESDRSRLTSFEAIGRSAINDNWSTLQTENALLNARLVGHASPVLRSPAGPAEEQVIEAAVSMTLGLRNLDKSYTPQVLEAANRRYPRGIGLVEPYYRAAQQNGYTGSTSDLSTMMTAAHAHQAARPGWVQANASTIDVPNLLSNVAEKILAERFAGSEQTWRQIAKIRSAKDYKPFSTMRMIGIDRLRRVAKSGSIEHGTIGDMPYTNKVSPYAMIIGVSEEDLVNDDLGAFGEIPAGLADAAGEAINDEFWTVWKAIQPTLFPTNDSNHNYLGATSTLDLQGLNAAEAKFRAQKKPKAQPTETDRPLGKLPKLLLTASAQANTAQTLMSAQALVGVSTGPPQPNVNVFAGRYTPVSSAWLDAYSVNEWWLLADPNDVAVIEVGLLGGREMPRIETMPYSFEKLGTQWRCTWGFGIAAQEYRGGVRNKGTATSTLAAEDAGTRTNGPKNGGPVEHPTEHPPGDPTQLPADPPHGRGGRR